MLDGMMGEVVVIVKGREVHERDWRKRERSTEYGILGCVVTISVCLATWVCTSGVLSNLESGVSGWHLCARIGVQIKNGLEDWAVIIGMGGVG